MFRSCILHYDVQTEKELSSGSMAEDGTYTEPTYVPTIEHRTYPCATQKDYDWAVAYIKNAYGVTATPEYDMTEVEYQKQEARKSAVKPEQLRADIDYVMLLGGF